MAARYWCYQCSQMVTPDIEVEIKCPFCQGGFIEEMSTGTRDSQDIDSDIGSDRALSLWAAILLGMMGTRRRRIRLRRIDFEEEDEDNDDGEARHEGDTDLDQELESIIRRRRSSATILQLLQSIRDGMAAEAENSENDRDRDTGQDRDRESEREILINPFNQTIILQGPYDSNLGGQNQSSNRLGSLGDYFIGPGFDLLMQHLAENDPNRYGTPPAKKEAIEAMPTVKIEENLQCCVCLDDFDAGSEAREMPCKHKFHSGCILPWLELHSSCPVCRHQMPADESKLDSDRPRNNTITIANQRESDNNVDGSGEEGEGGGRSGRRFSFSWPFSGLFSSESQPARSNSSSTSSASQSGTDEN